MPADRRSLKLTELYHSKVATLADRAAAAAVKIFLTAPQPDLQERFTVVIPTVADVVTAAESAAATMSSAYFRSLGEFETRDAFEAAPAAEGNAGFTSDGRPLIAVLSSTPPKVFSGLANGWTLEQALKVAAASFQRVARTEIMDAASTELLHQIRSSDRTRGWEWSSRGTCGACLALDDGSVRSPSDDMQRHPNCACEPFPVFDVPERVKRPTGRDRFEAMRKQAQEQLLGAQKARLLATGAISWDDLISKDHHQDWSDSVVETSLVALLASSDDKAALENGG